MSQRIVHGTIARDATPSGHAALRRGIFLVPVIFFLVIALALGLGLTRDPGNVPSALIGKAVPEFNLPPVQGRSLGLSSADIKGELALVNVFASWCTSCRYEHPVFINLKEEGVVPLHGIYYKDRPEDAASWLDDLGDSYTRTGADLDGRGAIEWSVYGDLPLLAGPVSMLVHDGFCGQAGWPA